MLEAVRNYYSACKNGIGGVILILLILGIINALCGCGHNVYLERETTGFGVDVPFGDANLGVVIGCSKTVRATVRGGASFETSSSNGGGLFSGAGGQSKITQFKSHGQLNEGNLVDILTSPECPEAAKVELAKNMSNGINAPYFPGSILQTKESTIHIGRAAIQSNGVEQIQSKDPQGLNKLIDSTQKIIGTDVANDALHSVNSVTHDVVNPGQGTIGEVNSVINNTSNKLQDSTANIKAAGKSIVGFAGAIIAALIILVFIGIIWTKKFSGYKHKKIIVSSDPDPDADFTEISPAMEAKLGDISDTDTTPDIKIPKGKVSSAVVKVPFTTKVKNFFIRIVSGIKVLIGWFMLIPAPVRKQIGDFIVKYIKDKKAEYDKKKKSSISSKSKKGEKSTTTTN